MNRELSDELVSLLQYEMKPALGVTEPVAVALASAKAYEAIMGDVEEITVITDPALYKTGISVVVPGTNKTGFAMAAILGVLVGNPDLELEVLNLVDDVSVSRARQLLAKNLVRTEVKKGQPGIYVEVLVKTSNGMARTVIKETHTNIILVEKNGIVIYKKAKKRNAEKHFDITTLKLIDLIDFVLEIPAAEIEFVLDAVTMNRELAEEGLTGKFGMGAGAAMLEIIPADMRHRDPVATAQILVASACDARLGGAKKPAMSIAGSGCHGVTATLPVMVMADWLHAAEEKLARAIALSFLVTLYIKAFSGRLSAFCGCAVTAAAGASAGIVYLLDGNNKQIGDAVANVAADVTGIICDGGNFGCALKTSTGASTAIRAAQLALRGVVIPAGSGIIGNTTEETIKNMGIVSSPGMVNTDKEILSIINLNLKKQSR
jgi:L-cysteine desulfidase